MPYYKWDCTARAVRYLITHCIAGPLSLLLWHILPLIYNSLIFQTRGTGSLVALCIFQAPSGWDTPGSYTKWPAGAVVPNISLPTFQNQKEIEIFIYLHLYLLISLSAIRALSAALRRDMLVITCSSFHLEKLRKRDRLLLVIFQI